MLGLDADTPAAWADLAANDLGALLRDHAHCELKAASNALGLVPKCALHGLDTSKLVDVAEEETRHFRLVMGELERRGLALGAPEVCAYAERLRKEVRARPRSSPAAAGTEVLVDRLLVAALIEARSCERFKLLAATLARRGDPLASFYEGLLASEARHHVVFVELAEAAAGSAAAVKLRLTEARRIEAAIASTLGTRPTVHG